MKHRLILFMAVITICLVAAYVLQSGNGIASLQGNADSLENICQ